MFGNKAGIGCHRNIGCRPVSAGQWRTVIHLAWTTGLCFAGTCTVMDSGGEADVF